MGDAILSASAPALAGASSPLAVGGKGGHGTLRSYAACTRSPDAASLNLGVDSTSLNYGAGAVTLLLINLENSSLEVSVKVSLDAHVPGVAGEHAVATPLEWHMTSALNATLVALNGVPLLLDDVGAVAPMPPSVAPMPPSWSTRINRVDGGLPSVTLAAHSYAFLVLPIRAPACL